MIQTQTSQFSPQECQRHRIFTRTTTQLINIVDKFSAAINKSEAFRKSSICSTLSLSFYLSLCGKLEPTQPAQAILFPNEKHFSKRMSISTRRKSTVYPNISVSAPIETRGPGIEDTKNTCTEHNTLTVQVIYIS